MAMSFSAPSSPLSRTPCKIKGVKETLLQEAQTALHRPTTDPEAPADQPERVGRLRVGFVSLGCPKNLVDSEVMMGLLDHAGAQITSDPESADVLVVNTCSFIDSAKQESVDTILEMARHKASHGTGGKAQKLIVAGCLVERYRDEIRKNIPEVDAVVGTGELENILTAAGVQPRPKTNSPFTILTTVVATGIHPTSASPAAPAIITSP